GSAPAWGAGGRGFKSRHPDHFRYTAHASSSPACVGLPHTMTQPRFRTPHVLLGALALLFSVTLTAQDAASRFAVAVVRADGAIVPFAAYHDGRWREMWTAVERKRYEIPATLDDIDRDWWRGFGPISSWWYAPPGGETTSLAVTGVRLLATPCSGDVGLLTDL